MSVRLSYADVNGNGSINLPNEILEENNYYPFGLKHKGYNEVVNSNRSEAAEKYKFGGKELNDELGLDLYDFGARNYDAAIGRWLNVDPLAEQYWNTTPYGYALNNPVYFIDPDGMQVLDPDEIVKKQKEKLSSDITSIRGMMKDRQIDAEIGNKFITFLEGVQNEIKALEDSEQVYNVFYDKTNKGNSGYVNYNFGTNAVDIGMGTTASYSVIGHELMHGFQFETGEISLRRDDQSTLYDIGDETAGYNRQYILEGGVKQFNPAAPPYYMDSDIIDFGKKQNPQIYQGMHQSSLSLSSKDGKDMRKATIGAGKNLDPVPEVYIGWEKDYNKGVKKRK